MSEQMEFPKTFEKFVKEYGFKDDKEVYTNGSDLISVFRVKQWLEHDNKLRTIEIDTAYECGKHANKWIPVSERLPEEREWIGTKQFGTTISDEVYVTFETPKGDRFTKHLSFQNGKLSVADQQMINAFYKGSIPVAWMPLPEPYVPDINIGKMA